MQPDSLPKTPEVLPEPYSISVGEFKVPPTQLEPYRPGDKISRNNFTNFLILSFAVSMGQPVLQVAFMAWLKLKFGFDYSQTLINFDKSGNWDGLEEIERESFLEAFSRVSAHKGKGTQTVLIKKELKSLCNPNRVSDESIQEEYSLDILKKINNFSEFMTFAKGEVVKLR
ncbi:MAG: hypothetical protein WCI76_03310 [bacterium]